MIAIDIDPVKIACSQWNAKIYGVFDKIEYIQVSHCVWMCVCVCVCLCACVCMCVCAHVYVYLFRPHSTKGCLAQLLTRLV